MILIDAVNIRHGGGKVLLDYLEKKLIEKGISHHILTNKMLEENRSSFGLSSLLKRNALLEKNIREKKPSTVFCFGNFPLPKRFKGNYKIVTFFQNALLLESKGLSAFGLKSYLIFTLKKRYLKSIMKNSDAFILQTPLIKERFLEEFGIEDKKCRVLPYFDLEKIENAAKHKVEKVKHSYVYPSSPQSHKNHGKLLDAWELLLAENLRPTLLLTIPIRPGTEEVIGRINSLNEGGAKIKNLGFIPIEDLLKHISRTEFTIFPSLEETIGLSLVEGVLMDTKILVSERPYYKNVVKPSLTFNPEKSQDIANKVKISMLQDLPKSEIIIQNQIENLINFLKN